MVPTNKNMIPYDPTKPTVTSGLRIGTPVVTRRGFKEKEMQRIVTIVADVLDAPHDEDVLARVTREAKDLARSHPLPYN